MSRIVIPNRTKRWFHEWIAHHAVANASAEPMPWEGLPSYIYDIPGCVGSEYRHTLTGLHEQIGVSIPITSGNYLGILRKTYEDLAVAHERAFGKPPQFPIKVPTPFWT